MLKKRRWEFNFEMLEIFAYGTVTVVHFTDQNLISKTSVLCQMCIRSVELVL